MQANLFLAPKARQQGEEMETALTFAETIKYIYTQLLKRVIWGFTKSKHKSTRCYFKGSLKTNQNPKQQQTLR